MLTSALIFAAVPVAMLAAGSAIAAARQPPPAVRSAIQHFAAGIVFAVVAVELLPDLKRTHDPWQVAAGFAFGVAFMLVLEHWTEAHTSAGTREVSRGLFAATAIDLSLDGVLLGVAFAAGEREGALLALALSCELLSLGLALTIELRESGVAAKAAIAVPTLLAAVTLIGGAALGAGVLAHVSPAGLAMVLAFGCAALLFLVTEELLVEAHHVRETTWATTMFFVGFLVLLLLSMFDGNG